MKNCCPSVGLPISIGSYRHFSFIIAYANSGQMLGADWLTLTTPTLKKSRLCIFSCHSETLYLQRVLITPRSGVAITPRSGVAITPMAFTIYAKSHFRGFDFYKTKFSQKRGGIDFYKTKYSKIMALTQSTQRTQRTWCYKHLPLYSLFKIVSFR